MKQDVVKKIIAEFSKKKILVFGDIILDQYLRGYVDRISPEAPVPVIAEKSRDFVLGGAGNVARNISALGGQATLVGIVGSDQEGEEVAYLCKRAGIKTELIEDKSRPTTLKTRIISNRHQLARVDREDVSKISSQLEKKLINIIRSLSDQDMIIISDYNKGILTDGIISALADRFLRKNIIADVKPVNAHLCRKFLAVTPNLKETLEMTGIKVDNSNMASKAAQLVGKKLLTTVVLTRGEQGITVFDYKKHKTYHLPAHALNVFDVTGAGDTVVAVLGLMLAANSDLVLAARVANFAAGIVVGLEGTSVVSPSDLLNSIN